MDDHSHKQTTGGAIDVRDEDVMHSTSDAALKGNKKPDELQPDELPNLASIAEARRQGADSYLVNSDLEDADERGPSPEMKEQK